MSRILLTIPLIFLGFCGYTQCPTTLSSITNFTKNGVCAPVNVSNYTASYTFLSAQIPADITIRFEWNDPTSTIDDFTGAGLTVSLGNTLFEATGSFTYLAGNECAYVPTVSLLFQGGVCETATQTVVVWNTDNFNGGLAIAPDPFSVCENSAFDVTFSDASTFNCNPAANDPAIANLETRYTQFVYGTNTGLADANRIKQVELDNGAVVPLTTATGAYTGTTTINGITGVLFGPIMPVAAPAAGPNNIAFPISAPADLNNVAGNTFEITLFNWNICNPYNNNPASPNYVDAITEIATITVVTPPTPAFNTQNTGGVLNPPQFCIDEDVIMVNGTGAGPYAYEWVFYDGPNDTDPRIGDTLTVTNPTFNYSTGGQKLIRLIASRTDVQAACDFSTDRTITVSPDAIAGFEFYDPGTGLNFDPVFCQVNPADQFMVGFRDTTNLLGSQVQFEFYNEGNPPTSGAPDMVQPGAPSATNIPDFDLPFQGEKFVVVRLVALGASGCNSIAQDTIFIYGKPLPQFTTNEVCEGNQTTFSGITDQLTGFTTRVNDDVIATYEWDFSYVVADGFNTELTRTNDADFNWNVGAVITPDVEPVTSLPGTHTVAVRMTTQKGGCTDLITGVVTVNENPDSQLSNDVAADLCPGDLITFTNISVNPTFTMEYFIEVEHTPSAYTSFTTLTTLDTLLSFPNPDDTTRTYQVILRSRTEDLCETLSTPLVFRISPDEESGFEDQNYDIFNTNCSPWTSTLIVDAATQSLAPDSYQWTLSDANGILAGYPVTRFSADPDFHQLDYQIENTTNAIRTIEAVLEVTKTGVCVSNDTFNLQISPQPASVFTIMRDEDCDEVVLEIEATQKGLTNYAWTFNPAPDNEFGSDDQRLISYTRDVTTGADFDASISLVTTNLAGCPSEVVSVMETIEKRKPDIVPAFTISSDTIQLPDAMVALTNTSTPDAGYTYLWEFGDGGTSDLRDPGTYTYTRFGSFLIRLTISDEFCEVQTSLSIVVLPADPVIDFVADTLQGCTPLTIQFTNLSQSAESGEFLWEFGDGSISELDNPIHTYFDDGNYSVRLRGTNNVGVTLETEKPEYIRAYGRPFADFLVSARVVFIPDQKAHFRNLSKNAEDFFWDFGDGTTSTEKDPSHAYTQEGFYSITLVATNALGCVDTLFRDAEIEAVIGGEVASPNAFTPNLSGPNGGVDTGGGLNVNSVNDIFLPKLEGVIRYKMYIYNKWGQLLFQTNNQNVGWDGYYKGKLAPAGVYVYKLELRYSDGRDEIKAGDVTLIR